MIGLFIALACMALAVLVVLWIAPEGWENEHGFHYGKEGDSE